jgi:polyhydroxyalkanoate synthase
MSDEKNSKDSKQGANKLSHDLFELAHRSQAMFAELLKASGRNGGPSMDPLNVRESMTDATRRLWMDPGKLMEANLSLWQRHMQLWQHASERLVNSGGEPVVEPERGDRRFRHPDWEENPLFDFIKQSYLITANWLVDTMSGVEGLDEQAARKVEFYTRQFADAFSPSNFIWTNPEVLRETLETNGENLVRGLENFRRDLERGEGTLKVTMTDPDAFKLGENIATTPGKVVFQNELIQLIQYGPTTAEVYQRPLLIVPPWINKYYILDLTPEKSFVRWAVDRGYTVFVMSWCNPDERLAEKTFADYMREGILAAAAAVEQATGERDMTAIGYCIGGTLLAATLAYMAANDDDRIKAATFFAAQVDFSEPGDLQVFIDEKQLKSLDEMMEEKGYLESQAMATTFNMLRANDLIWSFYVNNYLLGKDPIPFDLLHWNADATRLPRQIHIFYLREMYLHNNLVKPGGIELDGTPIDLRKVQMPVYLQASKEDHIAPYPSVFKATTQFTGPVRFMLAGSGHIAGVINPPGPRKYQYWLNAEQPTDLEEWLEGAEEHPGSWWPDWDQWLSELSGPKVPARNPGDGKLPVIEDAPGTYVRDTSQQE